MTGGLIRISESVSVCVSASVIIRARVSVNVGIRDRGEVRFAVRFKYWVTWTAIFLGIALPLSCAYPRCRVISM